MNETIALRSRAGWQPTVIATAAIVLAALWIYRDTVASLVTAWGQSQTFAHGYWVPVIVLWLLWRQRAVLAALAPSFAPSPSSLPAVAAMGLVWLVGDLAEVNPARQFALVGMIVLTVPLLAGWRTARALMFPLGFLFFAVPFGEFLLPWLMDRTADFTVLALRASGIPVYRDGMQMIIPTGTWSVVEACSGIRYLIASLMVGALFAYLHYRTTSRRVWFMLVAIAVPIVANWVRAYLIVMIGHLSNNTLAVGVDHLIYGWVFFGVVIAIMFAIGMRWSEPPLEQAPSSVRAAGVSPRNQQPLWSAAAGMVMLLALPPLVLGSLTTAEDRNAPRLSAPALDGAPLAAERALPGWAPVYVNPSATVMREYTVQGRPVGLFIAYYRGQGPQRRLVSSVNVLVTSNDLAWAQVSSGSRQVALGDRNIVVRTASVRRRYVASFDATTLAVRQIYWVNGTFVAGDPQAKAWAAWHRLLGRGDDGAAVIVYTLEHKPGDADALLDAFMRDHLGAVDLQLRKTRDGD